MKGTFFQKPLELQLQIEGESWRQADSISGKLLARNHGGEPIELNGIQVRLARGALRKVRQKSVDAFDLIESIPMAASGTLPAGGSSTADWSFQLDRNAPVTDNLSSLFILYGRGDTLEALGQLQLHIGPIEIIDEFLKRLSIGFRFVVRSIKAGKAGVDVKLDPPDAKAFTTLEGLTLSFQLDDDETLNVQYVFQVKKVEATAASFDVKKDKRQVEQTFRRDQYRVSSGRINHDALEESIREALSTVEAKVLF